MQNNGSLYLIPTPLSENALSKSTVPELNQIIPMLDYFLVEDLRTARRFISSLKLGLTIEELNFKILNKKTPDAEIEKLLLPLKSGKSIGLMSEAGCPGIADPGARAVVKAHAWNCKVYPLVGPSSIFLALMASGLNGQQFTFHGYLPIKPAELSKKVKSIEEESARKNQTQIFIEAPYRNDKMLQQLIKNCRPETKICVARDLTGGDELIITKSINEWKNVKIELHKIPTIFLMLAN